MTKKPLWTNRDERTRWINLQIRKEAGIKLGNSIDGFSDRVATRCRLEMQTAGISSIVIWWIVKFIVIQLVEYFFFSSEADAIRCAELEKERRNGSYSHDDDRRTGVVRIV